MSKIPNWIPNTWEDKGLQLTTPSAGGNFLVGQGGSDGWFKLGIAKMVDLNQLDNYKGHDLWWMNKSGSFAVNSKNSTKSPCGTRTRCLNYSQTSGGQMYKPSLACCGAGFPTKWEGNVIPTSSINRKPKSEPGALGFSYSRGLHQAWGGLCYDSSKEDLYWSGRDNQGPIIGDLPFTSKNCGWMSMDDAVNCCSMFNSGDLDQCKYSYNSNIDAIGSVCPAIMVNYCSKEWVTNKKFEEGSVCSEYLQAFKNSPQANEVVQKTIINYINSKGSVPDYIPSRDKDDAFYQNVMPDLCGALPGACDDILNYYCASHTREELMSETKPNTLRRLCGCHLTTGTTTSPPKPMGMNKMTKKYQSKSQYPYPSTTRECDPICNIGDTIQLGADGKPILCTETVCIIDRLNINNVLSKGRTYITQDCGGKGKGKSDCYIDRVSLNKINSQSKVNISQSCGSCFVFDPNNPSDTSKITCPGSNGPSPPSPPSPGIKGFFEKHKEALIIAGVIVGLLFLIIVLYLIFSSTKKTPVVEPGLDDYWSGYNY